MNTRVITKFIQKKGNIYSSIEINDRMYPNSFNSKIGGQIKSSVYGLNARVSVKLKMIENGKSLEKETFLHPDRIHMLAKKIMHEQLAIFRAKDDKYDNIGFNSQRIFVGKEISIGDKVTVQRTNICYQSDFFYVTIEEGEGKLIKNEMNQNDISDYMKKEQIRIELSMLDMYQVMSDLENYLLDFHNQHFYYVMTNRSQYEDQNKNKKEY